MRLQAEAAGLFVSFAVYESMKGKEGLTLLIVDDDSRIRELAEYAAVRTGLFSRVTCLPDGQAAVEWLRSVQDEELPSVVLTDLSMPRLDGLDLARRLQEDAKWRDIPIAMFSSSNHPNDESLAMEAGCRVFFPKPNGLEQLTAMIGALPELVQKPAGAGG